VIRLHQLAIHDHLDLPEMARNEKGLVPYQSAQEDRLERLRRSFTVLEDQRFVSIIADRFFSRMAKPG
jgi:hypothetical protein